MSDEYVHPCYEAQMSKSILVAQSDPTLINLHTLMLKRAGNIVAKAANAQTLASVLTQYTCDVIVYDVQIDPEFEILSRNLALLRQSNTVLIVTAFDNYHEGQCRVLGLPYTTVAPTAVTQLSSMIERLTVKTATR
jgi:two-component SAPR family response regulator